MLPALIRSPRDPAFVQDPYPFYAEARALGPLFLWEDYGFPCAAGHATGIALLHASFGCQRAGALPRNADRPTGGLRRWGDREIPSENRSVRG